ncbi:unnamed protein product [Microthlaspi erraticum]|uniref:Uncharacterized protein n=1 Tax=Microthlaspi erraticum TaxID=1685480 RepID=A0A6D2K0F7_9BRAS|nr:unnamed protein product [Microthlaspi erraticum]
MPSGAKKRKAAKKKQEQASSTQINLKSNNNHDEDAIRIKKEHEVDTDERIEITDSSHDHDKSSNSSSSNSSSSSSSSDDESQEVKKKKDDKKETGGDDSVSLVISVPDQPIPVAGDAPFMGSSANAIVENTGLIDSTAANDPNSEKMIEILSVGGTMVSKETPPLPKPNETAVEVSSGTDSDVKENEGEAASSSLLESNDVPQGSRESEVVISHEEEEEAPVRPTHGVAQRTSWLSCCGLFDAMTGSGR